MLLARYLYENAQQYGVVEGNSVRTLAVTPFDSAWDGSHPVYEGRTLPLSQVNVLAPCQPSKYVGVGLNYLATIRAMNRAMPKHPILFVKPSTSVVGDGDFVKYPHPCSGETPGLAFEGELAVVIGKKCKNVEIKDAKNYKS